MSGIAKAGMEEWDGNARLSRSQSVVASWWRWHCNLGLCSSPVSLRSGRWRWWAGTKVAVVIEAWN
jgi:hypothetical protein